MEANPSKTPVCSTYADPYASSVTGSPQQQGRPRGMHTGMARGLRAETSPGSLTYSYVRQISHSVSAARFAANFAPHVLYARCVTTQPCRCVGGCSPAGRSDPLLR
eukprot:2803088-Rhodomonas_salina.3